MQTIALFGGTGKTGQEVLKQALDKGYNLRLLARTPSKINIDDPKLVTLQGDVLNPQDVHEVVKGSDIIISVFGQVKGSPKDVQTRGTQHIIDAMEKENLKRIISLSGGGLPFPEKDEPKIFDHLIRTVMKIFVPGILKDAKGHHQVLQESNTEWTIVRGPVLTEQEKKGTYRVGWVGVNSGSKIGRADLADFILTVMEERSFIRQMPFVSY